MTDAQRLKVTILVVVLVVIGAWIVEAAPGAPAPVQWVMALLLGH